MHDMSRRIRTSLQTVPVCREGYFGAPISLRVLSRR
jgi:hypothetical protein